MSLKKLVRIVRISVRQRDHKKTEALNVLLFFYYLNSIGFPCGLLKGR